MEKKEKFDEVTPLLAGDRILRLRRRKPRLRLRIAPNIPGVFRFIRDLAVRTPLIPLILTLAALWLLFSLGLYLAEREVNGQITSYGYALWWSLASMHTMGLNNPGPITTWGIIIGSMWAICSSVVFFGVIAGVLYAYFMVPKRRPSQEIISVIQHNLEELENLSTDELEVLRDVTVRIIDAQRNRAKEKASG